MRIVTYCLFVSLQLYATCPRVLMMDDPLPEITINAAELSDVISFVAISSRCLGTKIKLSADECAQKFIYTITIIDDKQSVFHELPKTGIRVTIKQDAGKTLHDFCLTLAKLYDLQYVRSNTNLTFVACRPSDDNNTTKGYFHYPIGNHSPFLIHDSNETRTFPRYSASNLNKYMSFIATDQIVICDDDGNMTSSGTFTYTWNGNVAEYVAAADGSVAAHYGYTPFGGIAAQSGALVDTFTHRFSTKPWCGVTGLYEYQFRKYSPTIGRWMSRDPIGEGNVFLYVSLANNFICVFDLLGLISPNKVKTDCEDAIAFKRAENNYVIKNPSPIDSMTEKKCNEMVDKIKSFNPVKPLLEQFSEDNNCPEPKISCSCCNWYENTEGVRKASTLGSYSASSGITLCWNNIEAGLKNGKDMTIELNKVLAHELTHALQSCRGYPIDCIGDLKREMEARICSNECRNFDECIIMALASSCGRKCNDPAIILHGLTDLQKWFLIKQEKARDVQVDSVISFGKRLGNVRR